MVKMRFRLHDPNTDMTDFDSQPAPLPAACDEQSRLLGPQDSVSKSAPERGNVVCASADRGGQTSLLPSAVPQDECVVETQFISHDSNTDMTDLNGQPAPLPAAHHKQPRLLDPQDSASESVDSCPSTQSPWLSQSLSTWSLKLCCRRRKTKTHPGNTLLIPLFAVDRCLVTAPLIPLFALPLHIIPSY